MQHSIALKSFLNEYFLSLGPQKASGVNDSKAPENKSIPRVDSAISSQHQPLSKRASRFEPQNLSEMNAIDSLDVEMNSKLVKESTPVPFHSEGAVQGNPARVRTAEEAMGKSQNQRVFTKEDQTRDFFPDPSSPKEFNLMSNSLVVSRTIPDHEFHQKEQNRLQNSPSGPSQGRDGSGSKPRLPKDPNYLKPKKRYPPFNQKLQTNHMMTRDQKETVKHRQVLLDHERKVHQIGQMKPLERVQVCSADPVRDPAFIEQGRGSAGAADAAGRTGGHGFH